jgi:glycerol-1-phosphate dehydrogenase [NAD(P)+]
MREALAKCVAVADNLLLRDKDAVRAVFEGLIISGVATEYAGVSRPASGVEHYISHIFDMRGVSFGTSVDTHGYQCAISTLIAVKLYNSLIAYTPDYSRAEKYVGTFDYADHSKKLADFVGKGAESMIDLEKKEKKYDKTSHFDRFEIIRKNWDEIVNIIKEELPSVEKMQQILKAINIPEDFLHIGADNNLVCQAFDFTKDIRDKYVLSRLIWDLGISSKELFSV